MPKDKKSIFSLKKRIYYHDTDCGGVVYYANYLKHLEEARTEFFLSKKINLKDLAEKKIFFVVRKAEIFYKAPLYYADVVKIFTQIDKLTSTSINFYQWIEKEKKINLEAKIQLVCINEKFKPQLIPPFVLTKLKT